MEVIGAVSSVVALVEATSKLAKGLTHLAQRWHNAPEEINALALATQELCIKFAYVEDTITNSPATLVDNVTRDGLTQLIGRVQSVVAELSKLHAKLETYDTLFQKAKWAVKDAKTAKTALAKVKDVEEGLSMWISFITLKGHSLTLQHSRETRQLLTVGFTEVKNMFSTIAITAPQPGTSSTSSTSSSPPLRPGSLASASVSTTRGHSTTALGRVYRGVPWESSSIWQSWGLHGNVIKTTKGQATDYNISFGLRLPLAWWFGNYNLKGEIAASFIRQNTLTLRHPSYFAVARVLDKSHPFIRACRKNKVDVVREMLRSGQGRPTDETSNGRSCLWYAIKRDNVDVVEELLENGADIDAAINPEQMTLLEVSAQFRCINVLRTLLQRGASTDHCDKRGYDIFAACWLPDPSANKGVRSMYLYNLVNEYVALDPKSTWIGGMTALQTAATNLDESEIAALISHGHDIEAKDDVARTALWYAATWGNSSAFFALLAHGASLHYDACSVEQMLVKSLRCKWKSADQRYYSTNCEAIARHLLRYGQPDLDFTWEMPLDDPNSVYPASVYGRPVTLKELAEAHGSEIEAWFLTLLQEYGHPHHFTQDDKRRLSTLRLEGHAPQGCVLDEDDDGSEDDETARNEGHADDDKGYDDNDNDEDDVSSVQDEKSLLDKEEQFWDAEEGL